MAFRASGVRSLKLNIFLILREVKTNLILRSSIGAYNYNLAKYLSSLLVPLLPDTYSVKDSFLLLKSSGVSILTISSLFPSMLKAFLPTFR